MVLLTRESRPPPVFILFLKSFIITIKDFFFVIYFERDIHTHTPLLDKYKQSFLKSNRINLTSMELVAIINHYYITHCLSLAPIEAVTPQQELEKRDKK
ncbi:hypothetical protein C1638_017860 [Chryseobacterium oncorhynchi]|uniref:Uncharacterized protein n=1 Tax=Chryseobacterium oncorhynchi TaxID=741074 RepID=A0A316WM65_9FLAO|nr:hypothetical protein C1638_017860 [Chryseobacterium oncorhynchi]